MSLSTGSFGRSEDQASGPLEPKLPPPCRTLTMWPPSAVTASDPPPPSRGRGATPETRRACLAHPLLGAVLPMLHVVNPRGVEAPHGPGFVFLLNAGGREPYVQRVGDGLDVYSRRSDSGCEQENRAKRRSEITLQKRQRLFFPTVPPARLLRSALGRTDTAADGGRRLAARGRGVCGPAAGGAGPERWAQGRGVSSRLSRPGLPKCPGCSRGDPPLTRFPEGTPWLSGARPDRSRSRPSRSRRWPNSFSPLGTTVVTFTFNSLTH